MSEREPQAEEKVVSVAELVLDPEIQPRQSGLDESHIAVLAEGGPETWPALVVVERDGQFVLIDGWHRLEAAKQLDVDTVMCELRAGHDDLRGLAFDLNKAHGKPLTLADRKVEAERLLKADATQANNSLAQQCGLSDKTVAVIRDRLKQASEIPNLTQRTGRDGKKYPATRSRSTPATSGATALTVTPQVATRENAGQPASKPEPAMAALQELVEHMGDFLDRHAGDEIHVYLAEHVKTRWQGSDRREKADVTRTLGEQLLKTADRLDRPESTLEKEQAA